MGVLVKFSVKDLVKFHVKDHDQKQLVEEKFYFSLYI